LLFFVRLFLTIDTNKDEFVEKKELDLMLAVTFVEGRSNSWQGMAHQIMEEYDVDHDNKITYEEFLGGLKKWCGELKKGKPEQVRISYVISMSFFFFFFFFFVIFCFFV
jgi:Ca2+-binding EF-hand superfamily protein